jgi:hypothetical protein
MGCGRVSGPAGECLGKGPVSHLSIASSVNCRARPSTAASIQGASR